MTGECLRAPAGHWPALFKGGCRRRGAAQRLERDGDRQQKGETADEGDGDGQNFGNLLGGAGLFRGDGDKTGHDRLLGNATVLQCNIVPLYRVSSMTTYDDFAYLNFYAFDL